MEVVVVLLVDLDVLCAEGVLVLGGQRVAVADDDEGCVRPPRAAGLFPPALGRVAADDEVGLAEGGEGHGVRGEVAGGEDYDMLSFFHRMIPKTQKIQKTT